MNTFGGLLILFSFVLFSVAMYEAWNGTEDALSTAMAGLFFLGLGFFLATRDSGPKSGPQDGAPQDCEPEAGDRTGRAGMIADETPAAAVISIQQTGDDDVLDRVHALLETHPDVTAIIEETGRWYSTPDRDDLPEWFALRVYCDAAIADQVMRDIETRILGNLSRAQADQISVSRFS